MKETNFTRYIVRWASTVDHREKRLFQYISIGVGTSTNIENAHLFTSSSLAHAALTKYGYLRQTPDDIKRGLPKRLKPGAEVINVEVFYPLSIL